MGIHMVNAKRVGDGKLRATEPEALLYEKRSNGTYRFTGVDTSGRSAPKHRPPARRHPHSWGGR